MNNVVLVGNLTKDAELRRTSNNKAVAEFCVAINNGKDTDFINCVIWGKQAENLNDYTQKGDTIAVEGSIKSDSYEYNGEKRYRTFVLCNKIQFVKTRGLKNPNEMFDKLEEPTDAFQKMHDEIQKQFEKNESIDGSVPW